MSNFEKFEELLRGDEALQAKLQELAASFEGDKTDEQAVFEATIGKLAPRLGWSKQRTGEDGYRYYEFEDGAVIITEDVDFAEMENAT